MEEGQKVAKSLFKRINNLFRQMDLGQNWLDAKGKFLTLVDLSTDERWARSEPWRGVFYLRFFYRGGDEKPTIVGIGSFTASEITLDGNLVPYPSEIVTLFKRLGFGVIIPMNPYESFEEMKKETLPCYQQLEVERAKA